MGYMQGCGGREELSGPVAPVILRRPRIYAETSARLSIISAPLGYGKRIAVQQWKDALEAEGMRTAHLALEQSTVSPERFWRALCDAVDFQRIGETAAVPNIRETPRRSRSADAIAWQDPDGRSENEAQEWIFRALGSAESDVVVFITDYQSVTSADLDMQLVTLLERSRRLRLVVSGRRFSALTGPLVTSRLAVDLITERELALTDDEALSLGELRGCAEQETQLRICRSVNGWPLAVQVASCGESDVDARLAALIDGLLQLVRMPSVRRILFATALYPGISVDSLASALPGMQEAAEGDRVDGIEPMLEFCRELQDVGLIHRTGPYDTPRFLCHPGIAQILRVRASSELGEELLDRLLHEHAIDFEKYDPTVPLRLYCEHQKYHTAEHLVVRNLMGLRSACDETLEILGKIPEAEREAHVVLNGLYLSLLQRRITGHSASFTEQLERQRTGAEHLLKHGDAPEQFFALVALVVASTSLGRTREAHTLARDLERRMRGASGQGFLVGTEIQALVWTLVGFCSLAIGDPGRAKSEYQFALDLAVQAQSIPMRIRALRGLAVVACCRGEMRAAAMCFDSARALGGAPLQAPRSSTGACRDSLAESVIEGWADPGLAVDALGDIVLDQNARYPIVIIARVERARRTSGVFHAALMYAGLVTGAPAALGRDDFFAFRSALYGVELSTVLGNLAAAEAQLRRLPQDREQTHIAWARLHIFAGEPRTALNILAALSRRDLTAGDEVVCDLLLAISYWQLGLPDDAMICAVHATRMMSGPCGFSALSGVPYEALLGLSERIAEDGDDRELLDQALALPHTLRGEQYERLSRAELRTLRVLAKTDALDEAASELFISLNTLKYHLRNIYRKLRVNGRTAAVSRALRIGLIDLPLPGVPENDGK